MAKSFAPGHPLEHAVKAGKAEDVVTLLEPLPQPERDALRPMALKLARLVRDAATSRNARGIAAWGEIAQSAQHSAAAVALMFCGKAADVAEFAPRSQLDLVHMVAQYRPPALEGLGEALMSAGTQHIDVVQELVRRKVIERPRTDEYATGLMRLPTVESGYFNRSAHDCLQDDPAFKDVLLRIFEVPGNEHVNLTSVDRDFGHKKQPWSAFFRALVERGVYSRDLMLEKTLGALERGWSPHVHTWFTGFHGSFDFTAAELAPHAGRYLTLISNPNGSIATLALEAIKTIDREKPLEPREMLRALTPALSSSVRAHVELALRLLEAAVKREPGLATDAAVRAAPALLHPVADVQKQTLMRLEKWPLHEDTRAFVAQAAPGLAAVHRERAATLAGKTDDAPPLSAAPATQAVERIAPLDPRNRLRAIETLDELVERLAYVLENSADIDEFERVLSALVRLAPLNDEARARLARFTNRAPRGAKFISAELVLLTRMLVTGEAGEPVEDEKERALRGADPERRALLELLMRANLRVRPEDFGPEHAGFSRFCAAHQHLMLRMRELMAFAKLGTGLAPLATPTHRHGFIEPAALAVRIAAYQERGVQPGLQDISCALLRLAPAASDEVMAAVRALRDEPLVRALRFAMGDEVDVPDVGLHDAAARIRGLHVPGATRAQYAWWLMIDPLFNGFKVVDILPPKKMLAADPVPTKHAPYVRLSSHSGTSGTGFFAGDEADGIEYFATLLPADMEGFFAAGALQIVGHPASRSGLYLQHLAESHAPFGPMATLLMAAGLAAPVTDLRLFAADALVASIARGLLDEARLAEDMRTLTVAGRTSLGRIEKALRQVYSMAPHIARTLLVLLGTTVDAQREESPIVGGVKPREVAAALELMLEIAVGQRMPVPAELLSKLEGLTLGGKGAALRAKLMAQPA